MRDACQVCCVDTLQQQHQREMLTARIFFLLPLFLSLFLIVLKFVHAALVRSFEES